MVLRQLFVRKHQLEIVHVIDSAAGAQPGAEFDAPIKNIISDLDKRRNKHNCESETAEERYSHSNVSKGKIRGHCD